jgi:hypothetical protein
VSPPFSDLRNGPAYASYVLDSFPIYPQYVVLTGTCLFRGDICLFPLGPSLIRAIISLLFRVGNMQAKCPSMLANSGRDSQLMVKFRKFPCIFPMSREVTAETSSPQTASTTIQFLRLSPLVEHGQKASNFAQKRGFSFLRQGGRLGRLPGIGRYALSVSVRSFPCPELSV